MLQRITDRKWYLGLITLFIFFCVLLLVMFPGGKSFFIINGMHHPAADVFFTWFTHAGDGITVVVIALLVTIFFRISAGLVSLLGLGLCGLTVSLLKTWVFTDSQRPKLFFWGNKMVHYVDGIYINIEHSFPSGHALTAFFCFTFIALTGVGRKTGMQFLLAICVILAAYSRVYLAHHFVGDITAGAITGVVFAILLYRLYEKIKNKGWLRYSLIGLINKKRS